MLQIGRQGQLYVVTESSFGTPPALAATDALRHRSVTMPFDNVNRRTILEKKQSPGHTTAQRTNQRKMATFNLDAILRPSGTLNTLPECDEVLSAAFGTKTNITLSTTVNAGTGAVGGATLASAAGLVVGDGLLITCPDGKRRIRQILTLPGAGVVTWAPNLPAGQQPADGAAVKGLITYKLTTLLSTSVALAHYHKFTNGTAGLKRICKGAVIDRLALNFDANDDPLFTASGPAKLVEDAPAQPGGFTMVGGQPPSGITSEMLAGNTAIKYLKMSLDLTNALALRSGPGKEEAGDAAATEAYRVGRRDVSISIDQRAETEADIYDLAEAGTNVGIFNQIGFTEGNCLAVRLPAVEFKVPDTTDPDEEIDFPLKGMGLESADSANDEVYGFLG